MNVLVTGREGQLGSTLYKESQNYKNIHFTFTRVEELDLTREAQIDSFFAGRRFHLIINCAAYTAVDKAEEDRETARLLNAQAPAWLGRAAHRMQAGIIHISTDYVFNGQHYKPLKPDDKTGPRSVYGKTKLEGEQNLFRANPQSIIIRTAWLYSREGQNFMKTMLKLGQERSEVQVVADQVGSPTLAADLAAAILHIAHGLQNQTSRFIPGIYHYANEGVCSWYDFATAIFELAGLNCRALPVCSGKFPRPAPRPYYSVLDKTKIKETYGLLIPHWRESLKRCISGMDNPIK